MVKTADYQVNFQDGTTVEITGVRAVIQKYGFLEFRGPTNNTYDAGSDLPLIIAYRAELVHSYEPSVLILTPPTIKVSARQVFPKRKYTKKTR